MIEVGTPLWAGGFGCVTWIGEHIIVVVFLDRGEPTIRAWMPKSGAETLAAAFVAKTDEGLIQTVL